MTSLIAFAATLGTLFAGFIIGLFAKEKHWKEKVGKLNVIRSTAFLSE